jgi:hypothetical protein
LALINPLLINPVIVTDQNALPMPDHPLTVLYFAFLLLGRIAVLRV